MPNERSRSHGTGRPETDRITLSPALLAVVAVATAVFADALLRCLNRTARLARETGELTLLARTDPLTGLHNRRHMEEHLAAAVSAARRHHHPLAVLFIDIDSFKRINDESGYEVGDDVLRTVGDRVRLALRTEDLVGRWGGEEFVAVLPATDLTGAVVVGERVRASIASHAVGIGDLGMHVTVSVGCASGRGEPAELIRQATRALRQAKHAGKNRVVAADPPTEWTQPS
ncbi:MAG TPA: GGDEF domain-containing protein [Acidimicrobiia bacterium]|nr:GGDEF domain-containing protein [Acidimicrobiia bacterium]HKN92659.1 GGDEF domain-containing protein [Acidimicrobiia bacterium]